MSTGPQHSESADPIAQLADPDPNVRYRAAMELGTRGDAAIGPALARALGPEEDARVREMLTWATVQHAEDAMDELIGQLGDPDPAVRAQTLHVLSKIGEPRVAPFVVPLIADTEPMVAIRAYRAAAATGRAEVIEPLLARLGDGEEVQRDQLARNLVLLGTAAVPGLITATADPRPRVRLHALETLAGLGGPAADPAAAAIAVQLDDPDTEIAIAAVMALGELTDEVSLAALARTADGADRELALIAHRLLPIRHARARDSSDD
ncbi:HEAT repeat domain-containing protein [Granulicoccus phenolivorans]|uniref:HEAT repeat domain-containing protein n=1 Tax=Granulicoccus phenolivorans TaxID=266854 RepID=UPI0003F9F8C8|nr:HEAT repeat domain-containing protein [Granulicoccus phenolivorans]